MGISGLIPLLKKATKNSHVRKLSGCTVAIDAYCWLHKGSFGCAEKLGKGEPTDAYITYCMKYIQVLLDNNIKPIVVLDGRNLPSKEHTEKKRREKRDENRKLARKYLQEGKRKEAWECFTKCVDITPAMARAFIKALRNRKIDYVVAPYEADAQLAYLAKQGIVDVVITEDSDLILFGCPKIFFKMSVNGDGVLFEQEKIPQCLGVTPKNFQFDRFRWMCIMSGCDYLPSLPGIGLGRAKTVILASTHDDIRKVILTIPVVLDKLKIEVPEDYIGGFIQAENTFLYQLVFDTATRTVVPLTPYPDNINKSELPYAGKYENKELAIGLALGNVDLHTLKTVDSFEPMASGYTQASIWSPSFNPTVHLSKMKHQTTSVSVGMELSVPVRSSISKKRSLVTAAPTVNDENVPDDNELMTMYSETRTSKVKVDLTSFSDDEDFKESPDCSFESPLNAKRRRVTHQANDDAFNSSPSINTRSRSRVLPFRKSPESPKIVVKSQYFRSKEDTAKLTQLADEVKIKKISRTRTDSASENTSVVDTGTSQLSIYSYDSSSENFSSEISSSQFSSQLSSNNDEIVLLDDEEDEVQGTFNKLKLISPSPNGFRQSLSTVEPSKTNSKTTKFTKCRRQGLSKSAKVDPKQQSLRDMFVRQHAK